MRSEFDRQRGFAAERGNSTAARKEEVPSNRRDGMTRISPRMGRRNVATGEAPATERGPHPWHKTQIVARPGGAKEEHHAGHLFATSSAYRLQHETPQTLDCFKYRGAVARRRGEKVHRWTSQASQSDGL